MPISVFKTLWKENFLKSETLQELTPTKIFLTDFFNTLRKIKIKVKSFTNFFMMAVFPTERQCFISSGNKETATEADRKGSCS